MNDSLILEILEKKLGPNQLNGIKSVKIVFEENKIFKYFPILKKHFRLYFLSIQKEKKTRISITNAEKNVIKKELISFDFYLRNRLV